MKQVKIRMSFQKVIGRIYRMVMWAMYVPFESPTQLEKLVRAKGKS